MEMIEAVPTIYKGPSDCLLEALPLPYYFKVREGTRHRIVGPTQNAYIFYGRALPA
jgi:hypothetical protein